jgi:tetratricopeptide (TPR) repeat protein
LIQTIKTMNIYYTIDEKYLKAIEKIYYNTPKAKLLLEEIVEMEPGYGKAHFHLGSIYYDYLAEYTLAVRHFDLALKFAPEFPEAYHKYLCVLNDLEDHATLLKLSEKALKVRGICKSCVYHEVGLSYEKNRLWEKALENYKEAYMHAVTEYDMERNEKDMARVMSKAKSTRKVRYVLA